ncbi:MAG: outer membrane protein assembly factor BamD [Bacteroidales bacterium]|jgi:outer membrane protein assembly factor BamD
MRSRIVILLLAALLVSSCTGYQKLLKSTDYDLKKEKAKEFYEAGKYVKSSELFEQLIPRFRATEEAEDMIWMNAQSYYGMKQYDMASTVFKSYVDQYAYGKYIEEACYLSALCDYNISPRPELDQENTRKAIEGFDVFLGRYPKSSRVDECKKNKEELEERLAEKSYLNASLYYNMDQYKAAVTALSNSLKEFTETKYREKMMYLKLNSLYLYAVNSTPGKQKERFQATLDDYFSFMEEFPKSQYARDVKKIYQDTSKKLKIGTPEKDANIQN